MNVDRTILAARRLSAALGRRVEPEDVQYLSSDCKLVRLKGDLVFMLSGGNTAYCGDGVYMRNGKPWDQSSYDGGLRPLSSPAQSKGSGSAPLEAQPGPAQSPHN